VSQPIGKTVLTNGLMAELGAGCGLSLVLMPRLRVQLRGRADASLRLRGKPWST